jgi:chemotaxis methyl-accepting protein methylase
LDRSEDVLEALRARRVDVSEVHRINLLSLLKYSGREKDSVWKEIANSMQKSGRLLLGSEQSALREVDRETGEILPTRK